MMSPGLRNGGTCAENYLNGNAKKVPIGKIGHRDSIKSAQLELANHDHENNLLNSKPMPKKIVSPSNSESNKRNVLSLDSSMGRRELRRVAAESGCARRRSQRYGSERSFSSQSSELMVSRNSAPSPGSLQSCSPRSSQPDNRVGSRGLWGKVRQAYAPTATELQDARPLPKLATFTQLWNLIFEIVRDNEMLELDEPDPRLWWRKVFINLRKVHGKGEH
ncbi:hypothetical protein EB796_009736 [Bugula neritina]|uniref:Uncharacterized protein n=1 Tax=Bugula neritina TaxID=10212 RepID=A0A7J7K2Y6_BUGNE|nr:hypothetical protein EB796_009736 [Bugula neritina]